MKMLIGKINNELVQTLKKYKLIFIIIPQTEKLPTKFIPVLRIRPVFRVKPIWDMFVV